MLELALPPWANPKNIALALLLVVCIVLGVRLALVQAELRTARASEASLEQRVADRDEQLRVANASTLECQSANASQQHALHAFSQAMAAMKERTAAYEQQLAAARAAERSTRTKDDAEDRAFVARPDVPSAAELNAMARKRGEGWLWH